jgi:tRNA pseudouridine38-40 synthase
MRFLKLTIAYEGTGYVGWQLQTNGLSIQQVLESAWHCVTSESLRITASGRTDSGVHALGQVCSLETGSQLPGERLVSALNANLPFDIRVLTAEEAPVNFHAIRDATAKTYRYHVQDGRQADLFRRRFCWHVPRSLNVSAIQQAAGLLVGTHDFSSFQANGAARLDAVRTISRLQVDVNVMPPYRDIDIEVTADGFLYNMVRNIVGTLVMIGRGRRPPSWMADVLASRDRGQAGPTAPPHGLFLVSVQYDARFH